MNHSTAAPADGRIDWDAYVPSEETGALAEASREHFATLFRADDLRAAMDGMPIESAWATLADSGYPMIGLPEELDGVGTFLDTTVMLEEAGRAILPAPLLTHAIAAQLLLSSDALTETLAAAPLAFAAEAPDGLRLFDGGDAEYAVTARSSDAGSIIDVHAVEGLARVTRAGVDPSRPWSTVTPSPAGASTFAVPASLDGVLAAARICIASDLIGVAARALDGSVAHALAREQFGRPIGSFQAVKHHLADAYVLVERARSLVTGGAVAVLADRTSEQAARLGMLAKAAAADAAARCTALQTQLLGAMGLTFESDSPLAIRRARQTIPVLGGPGELYARVAQAATAEVTR